MLRHLLALGAGALENPLGTHWSLGPATLTRVTSSLTNVRHGTKTICRLVTLNIHRRQLRCAVLLKGRPQTLQLTRYFRQTPDAPVKYPQISPFRTRQAPATIIHRALAWSRLSSMWELETSKPVGVGPDVVLGTGLSIQPSCMPASMTRAVHHADRDNPEQSFQPGSPRPPLWIERPTSKWLEMDGREESIRVLPLMGGRVLPRPVSFFLNKQSSTPYTRVWKRHSTPSSSEPYLLHGLHMFVESGKYCPCHTPSWANCLMDIISVPNHGGMIPW